MYLRHEAHELQNLPLCAEILFHIGKYLDEPKSVVDHVVDHVGERYGEKCELCMDLPYAYSNEFKGVEFETTYLYCPVYTGDNNLYFRGVKSDDRVLRTVEHHFMDVSGFNFRMVDHEGVAQFQVGSLAHHSKFGKLKFDDRRNYRQSLNITLRELEKRLYLLEHNKAKISSGSLFRERSQPTELQIVISDVAPCYRRNSSSGTRCHPFAMDVRDAFEVFDRDPLMAEYDYAGLMVFMEKM